jgi:para-nitrobenzyl esterase
MVFIFAGKSIQQKFSLRPLWAAFLFLIIVAATSPMAQSSPTSPTVSTNGNVFRGLAAPGMNEFLGIRYALAPVGNLRWRAPRAPEHVNGIQDATQFANHCPQPASPFGLPSLTEDCLFLNVFTPAQNGSANQSGRNHGLPVMLWMHGGALVVGESDDYNPQRLVAEGVIGDHQLSAGRARLSCASGIECGASRP